MRFFSGRGIVSTTILVILLAAELWTARWIEQDSSSSPSVRQQDMNEEPLQWNLPIPSDSNEIRQWGCNRTETPLIFVHIGKSGGGSVRARIAASSLNFTKKDHRHLDESYYPLANGKKARFIASTFAIHLPSKERSYEGTSPCHASTPIGGAIGCPETVGRIRRFAPRRLGECNEDSNDCNLVYVGHNLFGGETNWLPVPYLQRWWASLSNKPNEVTPLFDKLLPNSTWCSSKNESRPTDFRSYERNYEECSIPLQREVDAKTIHVLAQQLGDKESRVITSWTPLYASLPVLRVTVMRDPFSWLLSKYFWHRSAEDIAKNSTCHNLEDAILKKPGMHRKPELNMNDSGVGWISRMALGYIMYLCGEDCVVRYAAGTATFLDVERQAESNLRQAFAVVGILEDGLQTFYEMLNARVQYIDTSLNPSVKGFTHRTSRSSESLACRNLFQQPDFREKLLERSPELRVLNRLYHVAKEVNAFQLNELQQCSGGETGGFRKGGES